MQIYNNNKKNKQKNDITLALQSSASRQVSLHPRRRDGATTFQISVRGDGALLPHWSVTSHQLANHVTLDCLRHGVHLCLVRGTLALFTSCHYTFVVMGLWWCHYLSDGCKIWDLSGVFCLMFHWYIVYSLYSFLCILLCWIYLLVQI